MSNERGTLLHYGVKGMKWGVTKSNPSSTGDTVTVKTKPGTYVRTSGGKKQDISDDAVKAGIARQKAKKSSVDALSNDELKVLVTRMNLEQQLSDLSTKSAAKSRRSLGTKFLEYAMSKEGSTQLSTLFKKKST